MQEQDLAVVILAAGKGTRMQKRVATIYTKHINTKHQHTIDIHLKN